jgi:competence protein ComEC
VQPQPASTEFLEKTYPGLLAAAKHTVVQPGDRVPLTGVDWRIVSSGGKVLKSALPGAGRPNPLCAAFKPMEADATENAHSVGSVVTFGRFRVSHLGDLTWNKEAELMCPANPIGTVDLSIVSHHGLNVSNSEVLVHALQPRVAIMNNGTRKGGQPSTMQILYTAPRLQDLWQMHFSELSGQEYTVAGVFIANEIDNQPTSMPIAGAGQPPAGTPVPAAPAHNGTAYWFKVTARMDGSFTVVNQRNGFTKNYPAS